jgi:hypothetical protein
MHGLKTVMAEAFTSTVNNDFLRLLLQYNVQSGRRTAVSIQKPVVTPPYTVIAGSGLLAVRLGAVEDVA